MPKMYVTLASADEWGAIHSMRMNHYERTRAERIPVPNEARWYVALCDRVVACAAVVERDLNGTVLWVTDMYCEPSRAGRLGIGKIIDFFELSDARIAGTIPVWNKPMLNALARRGYYPAEITMEKDQRVRAF